MLRQDPIYVVDLKLTSSKGPSGTPGKSNLTPFSTYAKAGFPVAIDSVFALFPIEITEAILRLQPAAAALEAENKQHDTMSS